MKEQKPGILRRFLSLVPVWCAGVGIAVVLFLLRLPPFRIWKVTGMENLPTPAEKGERPIILVANHPSLLEPIALLGLFAKHYIFTREYGFSIKYGPWNIAEIKNYRRGLFRLMEPRLIFIDRSSAASGFAALRRAAKLLKAGAILLLFAEGGRTCSVQKNAGKNTCEKQLLVGKNGAKIRPFETGAGFLAVQTQAIVIPVWVLGTDKVVPNGKVVRYPLLPRFWNRVGITIGKPMTFAKNVSAEEATCRLEKAVLDLA